MSDRYQGFTSSPIGKLLVKNLGLPDPTQLERYTAGAPLVDGTVVVGGTGRLVESLPGLLDVARHRQHHDHGGRGRRTRAWSSTPPASTDSTELHALRDFFTPKLRSLATCPRVVVIGTPPEQVEGAERVAQRALEGFTRSLGKEIGRGGTVQLVYVAEGAEGAVDLDAGASCSPPSRRTSPAR